MKREVEGFDWLSRLVPTEGKPGRLPLRTMDDPIPGFVEGRFAPDNWNDPTISFIRQALSYEDKVGGVMQEGGIIKGVKFTIGVPSSAAERESATFVSTKVATALGWGIILACLWHEDRTMVLILPEEKKRWFYISWYKDRGSTDKLCYLIESKGVFEEAEPMTYEDAVWLGWFLNSIQERESLEVPKIAFTKLVEKSQLPYADAKLF